MGNNYNMLLQLLYSSKIDLWLQIGDNDKEVNSALVHRHRHTRDVYIVLLHFDVYSSL